MKTRVNAVFERAAEDAERGGATPRSDSPSRRGGRQSYSKSAHHQLVLKELPADVAEALAGFDIDGDGTVNLSELRVGADKAERAVSKHHFYRKLFIILFGIWLAQLGSTFGVVFGVVNYAKESIVSKTSAQMLTKDSTQVVQTAAAMVNVPLSSSLPDAAFMELKTIGISSPTGATMHLSVLGFVRMPGASGGVDQVVLVTHIGRIILTGGELSYIDDSQAALFQQAGFTTIAATRRLLQVRALFGIFNAVSAVTSAGVASPVTVPPPTLPDAFTMFARRLTPCVPFTQPNGAPPPLYSGVYDPSTPLPRTLGVDLCDLLNVNDTQLLHTYNDDGSVAARYVAMTYTMYRLGSTLLRVEYEHPLVPGQILVEVLDASVPSAPVQFSYQVASGDKGIGLVPQSGTSVPALVGPVAYYNATNVTSLELSPQNLMSAPMTYLGNTSLGGEDVRIWALHLFNNSLHAYWYDSVDTQTVRRIAFGDVGALDVVSVTPLDGSADDNAHLFMQPEAGITDMAGDVAAGASAAAAPLPTKISLDPFAPFLDAYKADYAASAGRRRRLLEARAKVEELNRDAAARRSLFAVNMAAATAAAGVGEAFGTVLDVSNFTSAGGRHLSQISALGCAANNKCPIKPSIFPGGGGYANQAGVFAVPACPVGFMVGPVGRPPCMYEISVSVSPTQVFIPLPVAITGTLGVSLCSDLTSYDQAYSNLALSVGLPGVSDTSPFSLFSWNIASVGLAMINEIQELQCTVDGSGNSGNLLYDDEDAALLRGMISRFGTSAARDNCACLRGTPFRSGLGFTVGGPDIPGIVLVTLPLIGQVITASGLAPFLFATKITPSIAWSYYPYFCGLTRNDIGLTITFTSACALRPVRQVRDACLAACRE